MLPENQMEQTRLVGARPTLQQGKIALLKLNIRSGCTSRIKANLCQVNPPAEDVVAEANHSPFLVWRYLRGVLGAHRVVGLAQFLEQLHIPELGEKTQQAMREVSPVIRIVNGTTVTRNTE